MRDQHRYASARGNLAPDFLSDFSMLCNAFFIVVVIGALLLLAAIETKFNFLNLLLIVLVGFGILAFLNFVFLNFFNRNK